MISRIDIEDMTDAQDEARPTSITLTYRNWRGEIGERTIKPRQVFFGATDWHPEPGWLLEAWDCDKQALRDFALADCQFADLARPSQAGDERVARLVKAAKRVAWVFPCLNQTETDAMVALDAALAAMDTPKGGGE